MVGFMEMHKIIQEQAEFKQADPSVAITWVATVVIAKSFKNMMQAHTLTHALMATPRCT